MRQIFVAGATGVLGRATVPLLTGQGDRVRALARSPASADLVRALAADPVDASLFDAAALARALDGCDAVLHLATRIPATSRVRQRSAWAENDRVRREGTRALVDAALAAGVPTLVYPSFAWVYADGGDAWIDATSGALAPLPFLDSTLDAEAEVRRFAAAGRRGVSLRLGLIYGPESPQTHELLAYARKGFGLVLGRDEAFLPSVWVRDAAAALVAGLGAPSGVYDVVDDEPATMGAVAAAIAAAAGKRRLLRPPLWVARLASGDVATAAARSRRISNRRFKDATGWAPAVRSAREGWALIAAQAPASRPPAAMPADRGAPV